MILPVLIGVALSSPFAAYFFFARNVYAFSWASYLMFVFIYLLLAAVTFGLFVWLPLRAWKDLHTILFMRSRRRLARPELAHVIHEAQRSVRLVSNRLPNDIQDALCIAQARGVQVRALLAQESFTEAVKEGVALPLAMVNNGVGAVMVVDERLVITGSLLGSSGRYRDTVMFQGGGYGKRLSRNHDAYFWSWRDHRAGARWGR